ncbi:MAG: hypothetical protein FJ138_00615 [Deltaproteobacteria bacterium]|nr:hypothetical protein [Deltaproteobacteria bacterium]
MPTLLTYLAASCLGLFIGVYALSAFAPTSVARDYYRRSWYLGVLFLAIAYAQKSATPATIIKAAAPSTQSLLITLLASLALSGVVGWRLARREAASLEAQGDA